MEERMLKNFELLRCRVIDSLTVSNLKEIREELRSINGITACVGVGGSNVVSDYASKILTKKNNALAFNKEPRDLLYEDISKYQSILVCSYSGNNYGVEVSFRNNSNKYLLSSNKTNNADVRNIRYLNAIEKEKSFVSLAATLIPMGILLNYYLDGSLDEIHDCLLQHEFEVDGDSVFEIMGGCDVSCASNFLESTMVESGIAIPVVHDKYSYCHGRSTLAYHNENSLIYFERGKELDALLLKEASINYKKTIILKGRYTDPIIDDFYLTVKAMYLAKSLAEKKGMSLSKVNYSPVVKTLYKYKGTM